MSLHIVAELWNSPRQHFTYATNLFSEPDERAAVQPHYKQDEGLWDKTHKQ